MDTELYYPYEGGGASFSRPACPAFSSEKLVELREEVRRILGELPVFSSQEAEQDFLRAWDTQMRVHHTEDDE